MLFFWWVIMMKESGENYLETILQLEKKNQIIRSVDIANALGVTKPSVSRAMRVLKRDGYIEQESYGDVTLTEKGRQRASDVLKRHRIISKFFVDILEVDEKTADTDACRIEHVISPCTIAKMDHYIKSHLEK